MRGRPGWKSIVTYTLVFQSTPPCGGDTHKTENAAGGSGISIHAPLRGRLRRQGSPGPRGLYFNPRPLAGATTSAACLASLFEISIHAPLRGRQVLRHAELHPGRFQSTPPCGGDGQAVQVVPDLVISIHAPLRGRPGWAEALVVEKLFQSTPPCGGDPCRRDDLRLS